MLLYVVINPGIIIIITPDSKLKDLRSGFFCVVSCQRADQHQGEVYTVPVNPDHLCPHALLVRYFSLASIHPDSDEYIFRSL